MKKIATLVLSAVLYLSNTASAQQIPYAITTYTETYNDLIEPISLSNGEVWDDPQYLSPMGFDFQMITQVFDTLLITYPGAQVIPFYGDFDTLNLVSPLLEDIIDAGAPEDSSISPISYVIDGVPGSRIYKLEWKDAGFYNEFAQFGTTGNRISFQLWLYEGSNVMEFHYGPNSIKDGSLIYDAGRPLIAVAENVLADGSAWEGLWIINGEFPDINATPYTNINEQPDSSYMPTAIYSSGSVIRFAPTFVNVKEDNKPVFAMFPNPADDVLNIQWPSQNYAYGEVYDITGQKVASFNLNKGIYPLDLTAMATGTYLVRITSDGKSYTQKVMKR